MNDTARLLEMLARIVNRASREKKTTAAAYPVAEVPLAILRQAREMVREMAGNREVQAEIANCLDREF